MKEKVQTELKQNFRPEFLNRIDATVVFRSLTVEEIRQIVDLMLARVRDQLRAQQMQLEVTQAAKDHLIKLGYDVAYGARPLRRVIQNMIEDVARRAAPARQVRAGLDGRRRQGSRGRPGHPRSPSRRPRSRRGDRAARPAARGWRAQSRYVCQSLRRVLPALGRPVPSLRRVEQPRRDRRP